MKSVKKYWEEHLSAAQSEGCSLSGYAKKHGLSVKPLHYWHNKLNKPVVERIETSEGSKFVKLRVAQAVGVQESRSCSLVLPSGTRLELSSLPELEWLAALGRAAQGGD
ncbi:hypothetical protein [Mycoavidus sp. SF9855]|uniref:IS66 family insertion sequence element accessory protein TnpA n=1 Tax=Mycoavidus sp. SF9855 TaxID=2968475 RepID=UPI00211D0198|nr:hypothetical protein [Mycoavidus sp. SF9855]UUM21165.1 hypothetical protein NQD60_06855 [Mycoavidus sp. SF9855]